MPVERRFTIKENTVRSLRSSMNPIVIRKFLLFSNPEMWISEIIEIDGRHSFMMESHKYKDRVAKDKSVRKITEDAFLSMLEYHAIAAVKQELFKNIYGCNVVLSTIEDKNINLYLAMKTFPNREAARVFKKEYVSFLEEEVTRKPTWNLARVATSGIMPSNAR